MPFLRRRQEDEPEFSVQASPPAPPPAAEVPLVPEPSAEPVVESQFQPVEGADEMLDMPLGTLIFRAGLIAPQQLEDALAEGLRTGKRLGEVLLGRGWLSEEDLSRLLAGQKGLPYTDIDRVAIDIELARAMTYDDACDVMALPLVIEYGAPVVAMSDPGDAAMERLRAQLGPETRFVVAAPSALIRRIDEVLGGAETQASSLVVAPGAAEEAPLAEPPPEEPAVEEAPAAINAAEEALALTPEPETSSQPDEIVPIVGEGEIDYPTFPSYESIPVPESISAPGEQLPTEVQTGEYGYFDDPSLLEGGAWQPGEPAPEAVLPEAEGFGYATEPPLEPPLERPAEDSWEAAPPEPSEEEPPIEQGVEEAVAEAGADEQPTTTPAWMRGEVNVITADVADFIDYGSSPAAEAPASQPAEEAVSEFPAIESEPAPGGGEVAESLQEQAEASEEGAGEAPGDLAEAAEPEAVEPMELDLAVEPEAEPPIETALPTAPGVGGAELIEYELVLRLSDGDHVPIGTYTRLDEAQARAGEVVKEFADAKDGSWPFIGGRYLRPETIVSIDIEQHGTGWSGSGTRGRMFSGGGG